VTYDEQLRRMLEEQMRLLRMVEDATGASDIKRVLEEQKRFRMVEELTSASEVQRALEAADPFRNQREQILAMLDSRSKALSALDWAVKLEKVFDPPHEDRLATDLLAHQRGVLDLARSAVEPFKEHLELINREYRAVQDVARESIAAYESIHKPIEDALRISSMFSAETLLGLSPEALVRQLDPLSEHLREFERFSHQFEDAGAVKSEESKPQSLEAAAAGLLVLKRALQCVRIAVSIWLTVNHGPDIADATLERIKEVMIYVADRQLVAHQMLDHLITTERITVAATTTTVRLRSGPSTATAELLMLEPDTRFIVTGNKEGWASGIATLKDGSTRPGWVMSDYLVPIQSEISEQE